MSTQKKTLRRSGAKIMASLILLLGSLSYIMILAVINGSVGFVCAMGVTVFGAVGVAKALGEAIALSYGWIIGLTIGCGVLRGLLRYFEQYSNHYIAFRLLAVLRDKIFGALRVLCPAKLESKQKGSIIAMITSDIETLEVFYAHTISPICIAVLVSTAVFLFVGFVSSWYLALVALAGFLTIGIVVPLISSGKLKESGVKYRAEFASFSAYFLDSIKGIKDIVLNNAGEEREKEVNRRSDGLLKETKKMKHNITCAGSAIELMVSVFVLITLAVGILLVKKDMLPLGRMIIGMVTVFSSFGPVIAVGSLPGNLTQTFASGDRVLNLLAEKPAVEAVKSGKDFDYEKLDVKDLSFSYDGQTEVLKDIKMHAEKGEIIGIVGESGCGKSTFLKLLLRFWERSGGEINYDDIDIDKINTNSLLKNVTMVSQSTYLFEETIEDNLRIAKPDATPEEIDRAVKSACLEEFIASLDKGLDTEIGERGVLLSGGQKQRIAIARAFIKNAPIVILDEATSALDNKSEAIVQQAIDNLMTDRTVFIIAHRLSTVRNADKIVVVNYGELVEMGSHDELMQKEDSVYRSLYRTQLK